MASNKNLAKSKSSLKTPEHGLYTAEIRVTKACNLACAHCSVEAGKRANNELSLEEIKNVLEELSKMDARYTVFTGGEPLMREDIFDIISYADKLSLTPYLDTNATLITAETAKKLKKSGIKMVQASLDGREKIHDKIRGKGAFKKAVEGIRACISQGLPLNINFTVSAINLNELNQVIKLAEKLEADSLSIERMISVGRGKNLRGITRKEFKEIINKIRAVNSKIKISISDPLAIIENENALEAHKEKLATSICGGCTAGIAAITISYDGSVYPCPKLPLEIGNIRKKGIFDLWLNNEIINTIRYRELKGKCSECSVKNLCGGCRAAAFAWSKDYLQEEPLCWR